MPPVQVRGDVFVARVFDNEDDFKRLDFTLGEVSSSAPWVKQAVAQNERKRQVLISSANPSIFLRSNALAGQCLDRTPPPPLLKKQVNQALTGDLNRFCIRTRFCRI